MSEVCDKCGRGFGSARSVLVDGWELCADCARKKTNEIVQSLMDASRYGPCVPCENAGIIQLLDLLNAPVVFWDVAGDSRQHVPCCWDCYRDSLPEIG